MKLLEKPSPFCNKSSTSLLTRNLQPVFNGYYGCLLEFEFLAAFLEKPLEYSYRELNSASVASMMENFEVWESTCCCCCCLQVSYCIDNMFWLIWCSHSFVCIVEVNAICVSGFIHVFVGGVLDHAGHVNEAIRNKSCTVVILCQVLPMSFCCAPLRTCNNSRALSCFPVKVSWHNEFSVQEHGPLFPWCWFWSLASTNKNVRILWCAAWRIPISPSQRYRDGTLMELPAVLGHVHSAHRSWWSLRVKWPHIWWRVKLTLRYPISLWHCASHIQMIIVIKWLFRAPIFVVRNMYNIFRWISSLGVVLIVAIVFSFRLTLALQSSYSRIRVHSLKHKLRWLYARRWKRVPIPKMLNRKSQMRSTLPARAFTMPPYQLWALAKTVMNPVSSTCCRFRHPDK